MQAHCLNLCTPLPLVKRPVIEILKLSIVWLNLACWHLNYCLYCLSYDLSDTQDGLNINVLQQTAYLVVNQIMVCNFAFLFNCTPVSRTSDSLRFWLQDLSIDGRALCFDCCQTLWGLPVGFLILRYSVLCTVEYLSLLYLLFISWFIWSGDDAFIS